MIELQFFVASFFRRFHATISDSMLESDMIMTDGFSGGPVGQKLVLSLIENTA